MGIDELRKLHRRTLSQTSFVTTVARLTHISTAALPEPTGHPGFPEQPLPSRGMRNSQPTSSRLSTGKLGDLLLGGGPDRKLLERWASKEVALLNEDVELAQGLHLLPVLDAFGDDPNAQFLTARNDAADNGTTGGALVDAANEGAVELDDVWLKLGEEGKSRMPGAKVIDGYTEAVAAVFSHDVAEVVVVDLFHFGDFEDDPFDWKVYRLCCVEGALKALAGLVNSAGIEVHGKVGTGLEDTESGGSRNRLFAAPLINRITIVVKSMVENGRRRLAFGTASKSFIGNNAGSPNVDNGLKSHGKRNKWAGVAELTALRGMGGIEAVVGLPEGAILSFKDMLKRCSAEGRDRSVVHTSLRDRTTYAENVVLCWQIIPSPPCVPRETNGQRVPAHSGGRRTA